MKRSTALALLASALFAGHVSVALADGPPTDASLRELMEVMRSRQQIESVKAQLEAAVMKSMHDALAGKPVTAEQMKIIDDGGAQLVAAVAENLSWDRQEAMALKIYRDALSQHEVEGMIAFYRSEAGQAFIAKMPLILQALMGQMQAQMQEMMPKIQKIQAEMIRKLEATRATPPADPAPPPG